MDVNTIYNANCLEGMKKIPDESIAAVITDPPYCVGTTSNGHKGTFLDNNLIVPFFRQFLKEAHRILKPDGEIYIHTDWRTYPFWYLPFNQRMTMRNLIVWDYEHMRCGNHYRYSHELILYGTKLRTTKRRFAANERDVWKHKPVHGSRMSKFHPAQKPLDLTMRMIENSTKEGDIVCNPFTGSGTTAVAAIKTKRQYIGFEIDPAVHAVATEPIQQAIHQS